MARDFFASRAEESGLRVSVDGAANLSARLDCGRETLDPQLESQTIGNRPERRVQFELSAQRLRVERSPPATSRRKRDLHVDRFPRSLARKYFTIFIACVRGSAWNVEIEQHCVAARITGPFHQLDRIAIREFEHEST